MERTKKFYLHLIVAAVIYAACCLLIQPANGLTSSGVYTVAAFAAIVYLWITSDPVFASVLAFVLLAAAQIAPADTIISYAFGNSNAVFLIFCSMLADALRQTSAIETIAKWFLSRKICEGRPFVFIAIYIGSAMFLTFFLSHTAIVIMYVSFAATICDEIGYRKNSAFGTSLIIGMMIATMVAEVSTPFSHVQVLYMMGLLKSVGINISAMQYSALGILFSLGIYALILICLRLTIRDKFEEFNHYSAILRTKRAELKPFSRQGKISVAVFAALLLCWLSGDLLKVIAPSIASYTSSLGILIPCMAALVLLNVIRADNKPIYSMREGFSSVPWSAFVFLVSMFALTYALTAESTGVSVWLANLLKPVVSGLSPSLLIAIVLAFTLVLTQFTTNFITTTVVWTVMYPILASMAQSGTEVNILVFGVTLLLTANIAFMLPSSQPLAPYIFNSGFLDNKRTFYKVGVPILVLSFLFLTFVFFPIAQMVVR